jgi:hypothetical protein
MIWKPTNLIVLVRYIVCSEVLCTKGSTVKIASPCTPSISSYQEHTFALPVRSCITSREHNPKKPYHGSTHKPRSISCSFPWPKKKNDTPLSSPTKNASKVASLPSPIGILTDSQYVAPPTGSDVGFQDTNKSRMNLNASLDNSIIPSPIPQEFLWRKKNKELKSLSLHHSPYLVWAMSFPESQETTYHGNCHCRKIAYTASLPADQAQIAVSKCTCSICRRQGNMFTYVEQPKFAFTSGGFEEMSVCA